MSGRSVLVVSHTARPEAIEATTVAVSIGRSVRRSTTSASIPSSASVSAASSATPTPIE